MDEYYNLDYEDIVDGVPVRFNYKQVEPETFGMTAEEVLAEDDKELNQRASLKYLAPYRDRKEVKARAKTARWRAKQRRRNVPKNDTDEGEEPKKRKRKKMSENGENGVEPTSHGDTVDSAHTSRKTSKKKRKAENHIQSSSDGDVAGSDNPGALVKRKKRRRGGKTYYVNLEEPKVEPPKLSAKEQKREQKKKAAMERLSEKRLAAYNIN